MEDVKVVCKCKDCEHWEFISGMIGYCYFWKYELGESPNETCEIDFCSNAYKSQKIIV